MRWYHWAALIILIIVMSGYFVLQSRMSAPLISDGDMLQMRADGEAEDESAFTIPVAQPAIDAVIASNPLKNVYFGDLHVHTDQSFDSYIFGNRLTPDQSYQFARG